MTEFDYWYKVSRRNGNRAIEFAGMIGKYNALLSSTLHKLRSTGDESLTTKDYISTIEKRQEEIENHFNKIVGSHKKKEISLT